MLRDGAGGGCGEFLISEKFNEGFLLRLAAVSAAAKRAALLSLYNLERNY